MNTVITNYMDLQRSLDHVVGMLGLHKTISLLDSFIGKVSINANESNKVSLVTEYIISEAVALYELEEREFFTNNCRDCREARMSCYYLIKKLSDSNYSRIARRFNQRPRRIMYFTTKAREMLAIPHFHKEYIGRLEALEKKAIEFIGKLN